MYNTYGVDLHTTYITQGRLTPTLGYQRYNAFSVELKRYYKQRHFTLYYQKRHHPLLILK